MRLGLGHLAVILFFAAMPSVAHAGSCKSLLTPDPTIPYSYTVTVVTLNGNGVATYAFDFVEYHPKGSYEGRLFDKSQVPSPIGRWVTGSAIEESYPARQLWSDRFTDGEQRFAVSKSDLIGITITEEDSPKVTITLKSLGNVETSFVGDCSADGMMHGVISITEPSRKILNTSVLLLFKRGCVWGCAL